LEQTVFPAEPVEERMNPVYLLCFVLIL